MRKILIMKLTRMGDIIEAAPLLHCIRQREPEAEVTMVVNSAFAGVVDLLPEVDKVISFPIFEFSRRLREGDGDLVDLYRELEVFTDKLGLVGYDLALNATNSRLSGSMLGFVRAREVRGLVYDEFGERIVSGPLIRYFGPNEGMRRHNGFNLSDFLVALYGVPGVLINARLVVSPRAVVEAGALLQGVGASVPLVGIQLGASEISKRWHYRSFADVARAVLEQSPAVVVLIGSLEERALAEAFQRCVSQHALRVIDLVGRTSVDVLAAVIQRMKLLITNDTGPMHMAAALGVRVINISLGSAYFWETAPYGSGHWILEPRIACRPCDFYFECPHQRCKRLVPADLVTDIALSELRDEAPAPATLGTSISCDVYRTTFDEIGLLDFTCLTPRKLTADDVLREVFRMTLVAVELGDAFSSRLESGLGRLGSFGRGLGPGALVQLSAAQELFDWLGVQAQEGLKRLDEATGALHRRDYARLEAHLDALTELDEKVAAFGIANRDCRLLTRGFLLEKEGVRGSDLETLLRRHRAAYARLDACLACSRLALEKALSLFVRAEQRGMDRARCGQLPKQGGAFGDETWSQCRTS